jgi:hypothetical protein
MDTSQPTLFDDDETARPTGGSIILHARPGRPLSKKQKSFNALIHRIEVLRTRLDRLKEELDEALEFHAQHVQPRLQRVTAIRKDLVRALGRFLDEHRLKRGDKQVLQTIVAEQLDEILAHDAAVDDDLRALFEQLHGADLEDIEHEEMEEACGDGDDVR